MTERPQATSDWLKPLDQRLGTVDGDPPLAVQVAAVASALLTPLMAYLAIRFFLDVVDYASRPGQFMWVQILGYTLVAAGHTALAVACPIAAHRLLRRGETKLVDRIGLVVGGVLLFVLALSLASFGRVDVALFAALGPAMLGGFALMWLVRRPASAQWSRARRARLRQANARP